MKLGVFNPLFHALSLEPRLDRLQSFGLEAVEFLRGVIIRDQPAKVWWI